MAFNNPLVHTSAFILIDSTLYCVLVEVKTMKIIVSDEKQLPVKYGKQELDAAIWDFIVKNEIMKGINIYFIIDKPTHDSIIYDDGISSFIQYFKLHHGLQMMLASIADMLAYRQWNLIGLKYGSQEMRKKWTNDSRISMIYISYDNVSISMVDDGKIIDGLSIGLYDKTVSQVYARRIDPSNPFLPANNMQEYSKALENVIGTVFELTHADYVYVYIANNADIKIPDTGIIRTRLADKGISLVDDVIHAVIMKDITYEDDPYFMIVARGDYQDLSVEIEEDDGTVKSMPIFQH